MSGGIAKVVSAAEELTARQLQMMLESEGADLFWKVERERNVLYVEFHTGSTYRLQVEKVD